MIKKIYWYFCKIDKFKILNTSESLQILNETKKSFVRFGDGEMSLISYKRNIGYQEYSPALADALVKVLTSKTDNCLIGIPETLVQMKNMTKQSYTFWLHHLFHHGRDWRRFLNKNQIYLSSQVTRPYIDYKDKRQCAEHFKLIKKLWEQSDIIIIEGIQTRLGVGNDLFSSAKSVRRILAPQKNAFCKFDEIMSKVKSIATTDTIIAIALGPAAKILVYELSLIGYRALDVGHIDIEYEWFLNDVSEKIIIPGKYTNEVSGGSDVVDIVNEDYNKEIIAVIEN